MVRLLWLDSPSVFCFLAANGAMPLCCISVQYGLSIAFMRFSSFRLGPWLFLCSASILFHFVDIFCFLSFISLDSVMAFLCAHLLLISLSFHLGLAWTSFFPLSLLWAHPWHSGAGISSFHSCLGLFIALSFWDVYVDYDIFSLRIRPLT